MKKVSSVFIAVLLLVLKSNADVSVRFNKRIKVTPEVVERIDQIEKRFDGLNVDEFLSKMNLSELDALKNDFIYYRNTMKLTSDDELSVAEIGIPDYSESFSSGEVRERIKYEQSRPKYSNKSDKPVLIKFKELMNKFIPAFDVVVAEQQKVEAEKSKIENAKAAKIRTEEDKVYNAPPCQKVNRFVEYCDNKKNLTEVQFQFNREKKLNARSGTENTANIRHYTNVMMSIEDQVSKTLNAFNKIKYSSPKQGDCEIRKIEDDSGLRFAYSEKTNKIVKELKKTNCQVDNWQPQDY